MNRFLRSMLLTAIVLTTSAAASNQGLPKLDREQVRKIAERYGKLRDLGFDSHDIKDVTFNPELRFWTVLIRSHDAGQTNFGPIVYDNDPQHISLQQGL